MQPSAAKSPSSTASSETKTVSPHYFLLSPFYSQAASHTEPGPARLSDEWQQRWWPRHRCEAHAELDGEQLELREHADTHAGPPDEEAVYRRAQEEAQHTNRREQVFEDRDH